MSHYLNVAQRENHDLKIWSVELVVSSETSARSLIKETRDPNKSKRLPSWDHSRPLYRSPAEFFRYIYVTKLNYQNYYFCSTASFSERICKGSKCYVSNVWGNKKQTEKSHGARQLSTRNGRENELKNPRPEYEKPWGWA